MMYGLWLCLLLLLSVTNHSKAEGRTKAAEEKKTLVGDEDHQTNLNVMLRNLIERQTEDIDVGSDGSIGFTPEEINKIKSDNVFGDDGNEPLKELFEHIYKEWEDLIKLQDADAIVNKYTEDCIHLFQKNGETTIRTGREEVKEAYEEWFNQSDVHSLTVEPLKEGRIGTDYIYLVDHIKLFNENSEQIGGVTDLVIFKEIKGENCDGGYEVQLVSEIHD